MYIKVPNLKWVFGCGGRPSVIFSGLDNIDASKSMLILRVNSIILNELASKSMLIKWGYCKVLSKLASKSMLILWGIVKSKHAS